MDNFNRCLKFILAKAKFKDAPRFTSKAFRRGATQETLQTGNNLETAKGAGAWAGPGFLSYVDMEVDAAFKAQKMLISLSDGSSSEDEGGKPKTTKLRRKWRMGAENKILSSSSSSSVDSTSSEP